MRTLTTADNIVWSADSLVAALGPAVSEIALRALRAGWLTPEEAEALEPIAASIAFLLGVSVPDYRGIQCKTKIEIER